MATAPAGPVSSVACESAAASTSTSREASITDPATSSMLALAEEKMPWMSATAGSKSWLPVSWS